MGADRNLIIKSMVLMRLVVLHQKTAQVHKEHNAERPAEQVGERRRVKSRLARYA